MGDQRQPKAVELAEESRETEWKHPSFVAGLFNGDFHWELVHPYPEQDAEDKRIGDEFVDRVACVLRRFIDPNEVDRLGEIPEEAILALAEIGCFGLKIPKEYGGLGMSQTNYNRIMSFIASYCNSTAVWLSAHQSIGVPQPLMLFGTEEQKQKYLPRLASDAISGFALTEPGVGSDPARMETTATPSDDGSYYVLNGEKLWCTNGPSADLLLVMAVTPSKTVKGRQKTQITAFIVETDMPGFEVGHVCSFMGIRGISNGLLRFRDVKVPAENVVGNPGDGLKIALTTLNTGRLTLPATSAAAGKLSVHFAQDWCRNRIQWDQPIGKHQAVGEKVADMLAETFAMDSINGLVCSMVDQGGFDIRLEAAMAKYYCSEAAWRVTDDFVQIRSGRGFETADSLAERGEEPIPAERMLRDARIARIIEGTSEIMRLFIAREALDGHARRIMPILKAKGSKAGPIWQSTKKYAGWYPRQWAGAGPVAGVRYLSSPNRDHLAYVGRTSRKLARRMFHALLRYRQKIEREQVVLRAFVDVGTELFAMAAVLSRTEHLVSKGKPTQDGGVKPDKAQELADYFCTRARLRIADAFRTARNTNSQAIHRLSQSFLEGDYAWLAEGVCTEFPPSFISASKLAKKGVHETEEPEEMAEVMAEVMAEEDEGTTEEAGLEEEVEEEASPDEEPWEEQVPK